MEAVMVTELLTPAEELAAERERHRGEWIAIKGNHVIDAAKAPSELIERLRSKGETDWVIDHVPTERNAVFIL
jgi:hypothetical protein